MRIFIAIAAVLILAACGNSADRKHSPGPGQDGNNNPPRKPQSNYSGQWKTFVAQACGQTVSVDVDSSGNIKKSRASKTINAKFSAKIDSSGRITGFFNCGQCQNASLDGNCKTKDSCDGRTAGRGCDSSFFMSRN